MAMNERAGFFPSAEYSVVSKNVQHNVSSRPWDMKNGCANVHAHMQPRHDIPKTHSLLISSQAPISAHHVQPFHKMSAHCVQPSENKHTCRRTSVVSCLKCMGTRTLIIACQVSTQSAQPSYRAAANELFVAALSRGPRHVPQLPQPLTGIGRYW